MLSPHQVYKSDQYFNLDIPKLANILCRLERFNAHTDFTISVGMHLLHCYKLAELKGYSERIKQLVLFHDVPEAYYGDIPSYIKTRLGVEADYQLDRIDREIYNELGIEWPIKHEYDKVKEIDLTALTLEAMYGFGSRFNKEDWPEPFIDSTSLIEEIDLRGTSSHIDELTILLTLYTR
jgi:hypothetical protein